MLTVFQLKLRKEINKAKYHNWSTVYKTSVFCHLHKTKYAMQTKIYLYPKKKRFFIRTRPIRTTEESFSVRITDFDV